MKKLRICLALGLALLLLASCGYSNLALRYQRNRNKNAMETETYELPAEGWTENEDENAGEAEADEYAFVFTDDGDFMYPKIKGWRTNRNPETLNQDYALSMMQLWEGSYCVVISEEAADFESFEYFHDLTYEYLVEEEFISDGVLWHEEIKTEDWHGSRYAFNTYMEDGECFMLYDIVASPAGHYVQKLAWTLIENKADTESTLLHLLDNITDITDTENQESPITNATDAKTYY